MRPTRTLLIGLAAASLIATAGPLTAAQGAAQENVTGTVRILVVDDPAAEGAAGHSGRADLETRAVADVGGRLLDLPPAQSAGLSDGDTVSVTAAKGATAATAVEVIDPAGGPTGTAATTVARSVVGAHTLTVLPVYWSAPDAGAPLPVLTSLAVGAADYWSQQSNGAISITPRVRDWVRIPDPGSCGSSALATAALAGHGLALPSEPTDHVLIYFPRRGDCGGWAGLGQVGGPLIWDNGYPLLDVVTHELGHNLGLGHANTASCTSGTARVTLSSSCTVSEYRDYADVMGIAMDAPTGSLNSALADSIGIARTVTAPTGTRTVVDLAPLTRADAVRSARIRTTSGWVYLDYRPAAGRDVRMPGWAGVQAHLLPDGDVPTSRLLDGQPLTAAFSSVALPTGTTWTVPGASLGVTVTSTTATGARVEIAPVGVTPTTPTAVPVITAPAGGTLIGSTTTLSWRVPAKVATLRLFVDGTQVASSGVNALFGTFRVSGLSHGRHTLTLQAVDAAGQVSAPSTALGVVVDLQPPTIPTGVSLTSVEVLTWRASTDSPAGVAGYLVSMDGGKPVRLGTVTSYLTRTPIGRHTWWVAAVDRMGNTSPASGLIVVRASAASRAKATAVRVVSSAATVGGQRTLTAGRTIGAS